MIKSLETLPFCNFVIEESFEDEITKDLKNISYNCHKDLRYFINIKYI